MSNITFNNFDSGVGALKALGPTGSRGVWQITLGARLVRSVRSVRSSIIKARIFQWQ